MQPIRPSSSTGRTISILTLFIPLALGCGDDPSGTESGFDEIKVQVSAAGLGSGRVRSSESFVNLDCPVNPGGIYSSTSPPCGITFDDAGGGGVFDIYATPDPGQVFTAWLHPSCTAESPGACSISCGVDPDPPNECTLSFDENSGNVLFEVTAAFDEEGDSRDILVTVGPGQFTFEPGSGTVVTPQAGYDIDCQIDRGVSSGTCVMLLEGVVGAGTFTMEAEPDAGSEFDGWSTAYCSSERELCSVDCGPGNDELTCVLRFPESSGDVDFDMAPGFERVVRDITVNVDGAGLGEGIVFTPMSGTWLLCGIVAGHTSGLCSFTRENILAAGSVQVIAARDGSSEFQGWDNQSCSTSNNPFACEFDCVANPEGEVCELIWDEDSGDVTFDMTARFESGLNTVVIEDDFDVVGACANWTADVTGNGTYNATDGCEPAGGDPDGYRTMTHEVIDVSGVNVSHWYDGGSYDPSSGGAIEEIIYSESQVITQPAFVGGAVGSYFRLRQGGTVYSYSLGAHTDTGWTDHSVRLTPVFFTPAPGPDFSAAGSEIQFGYGRSNSNTSAGATSTTVHGIDNWRVVIVQKP